MMNRSTAVITGGTDGIGREMIGPLLEQGFKVLFVGRNAMKGSQVAAQHAAYHDQLVYIQADLSLMKEVNRVAEVIIHHCPQGLGLLVHSAGIILPKRDLTEDGIERTWAVDYLSRYYLTALLTDKLIQGQPSRVITIAASSTRKGKLHWDDLEGAMRIGGLKGLGQAQYANDVFIVELARRFKGQQVQCLAVNPGAVETQIRRELPQAMMKLMGFFFRSSVLNAREGAEAPLQLALSKEMDRIMGSGQAGLYHRQAKLSISPDRADAAVGARLWELSERMIHRTMTKGRESR
ncbi:SDR family NAD(P)-dependent oxidoreductase [Paenibacillus sp. GCM10023252]|uniref:SDR family NAD(P)-dependent oxidoreductase n=1 Tax=Paenibacillus sp. GCM10023252 TaxID=3252649 RepID=UPI00361FFAD6